MGLKVWMSTKDLPVQVEFMHIRCPFAALSQLPQGGQLCCCFSSSQHASARSMYVVKQLLVQKEEKVVDIWSIGWGMVQVPLNKKGYSDDPQEPCISCFIIKKILTFFYCC